MKEPRFERTEKPSIKTWEEMQDLHLNIKGSREDFLEMFEVFDEEFREADESKRKDLLMERYVGGFAGDAHGILTDSHIRFYRADLAKKGIELGNVDATLAGDNDLGSMVDLINVYQYGPSRIIDVQPGGWFIGEIKEQDVVGSSLFSCCSAVMVVEEDKVAFCHVRMGDVDFTKKMVKFFEMRFSKPQVHILHAESDSDRKHVDENINSWYEKMMAEFPQAIEHKYPYIIEGMRNNPHGVNSTSAMITKGNLRVVGMKERHQKKQGVWGDSYQTLIQPVIPTISDTKLG